MKIDNAGFAKGLDRLATPDEIRTALALFDDVDFDETKTESIEIPSDLGGYVRIPTQELEFLSLIEEAEDSEEEEEI